MIPIASIAFAAFVIWLVMELAILSGEGIEKLCAIARKWRAR